MKPEIHTTSKKGGKRCTMREKKEDKTRDRTSNQVRRLARRVK